MREHSRCHTPLGAQARVGETAGPSSTPVGEQPRGEIYTRYQEYTFGVIGACPVTTDSIVAMSWCENKNNNNVVDRAFLAILMLYPRMINIIIYV